MPRPEERLLLVVHALLHRCYKMPFSNNSPVRPRPLRPASLHLHSPIRFAPKRPPLSAVQRVEPPQRYCALDPKPCSSSSEAGKPWALSAMCPKGVEGLRLSRRGGTGRTLKP